MKPDPLLSFPRELYALIDYADSKVPKEERKLRLHVETRADATTLIARLNKLRKSLIHHAPQSTYATKAAKFIFRKVELRTEHYVVFELRYPLNALDSTQLPGFDKFVENVTIPESGGVDTPDTTYLDALFNEGESKFK